MSADSSIYSMLGLLSVVGVMVRISNHFYGQEFSSLSKSPTLYFQLMIISFSLGMGPIPWLIMSEVLILSFF